MSEENIKVLLVDDDVIQGEVIVTCLKSEGFNVEYVTSLLAMESMVKTFCPNVIVLDIEVGEGNGIDEMRHIREYAPDTPVIFISSHVDSDTAVRALGAGGAVYLRKPFEIVELAAYIRNFSNTEKTESLVVEIGGVSIDTGNRELTHADGAVERLTKMQLETLLTLIENANKLTPRTLLYNKLWPDGNSSEASLDNLISKLRKMLSSETSLKIETIPKKGFELKIFEGRILGASVL